MSSSERISETIDVKAEKEEIAEDWIDGSYSDKSGEIQEAVTETGVSPENDIIGFAGKAFMSEQSQVAPSSFIGTGPNIAGAQLSSSMSKSMIHKEETITSSQHQHITSPVTNVMTNVMCPQCHNITCICTQNVHASLPVVCESNQIVDCCNVELNKDSCPEVIVKHPDRPIQYQQDIGIRYLKPPTPPPSGNIVIREVRPKPVPEAPPLYVRLKPERPKTPPPLIIREAPPKPPRRLSTVVIDKVLPPAPPPPRKVIVEKLPPLPPKPRQVIIEKWLPYDKVKRNVIYQKLPDLPPPKKVRNKLITWTPIKAQVIKKFHNLGILKADPSLYASQHCSELKDSQLTMNTMINMGAPLHYQEAAGAEMSGEQVYFEDKEEIDRLMKTNFHPNDPVCRQYLEKHGGLFPQQGLFPQPYMSAFQNQNICTDEQRVELQKMHSSTINYSDPCADISWLNSAYGPVVTSSMGGGMTFENSVSSMYPQFCQDASFVPLCPGPTNVCPFAFDNDHCFERCSMCQQLSLFQS